MKKLLTIVLALFSAFFALAYDFAYVNTDGVWYYVDIVDDGCAKLVRGPRNAFYEPNLLLPDIVIDGNSEYKVTEIGESAFYGCGSIQSLTLPKHLKKVHRNAFGWCYALKDVAIGAEVEYISPFAFQCCGSLENIALSAANQHFALYEGAVCDKSRTKLVIVPGGYGGNFELAPSMVKIEQGACYDCSHLTGISFPKGMDEIGDYAFYFCGSLEDVYIPAGIRKIGRGAFGECSQLAKFAVSEQNENYTTDGYSLISVADSSLVQFASGSAVHYALPEYAHSIGHEAFFRCYDLKTVQFPQRLTAIGDAAFAECWGLESIFIPASVDSIGMGAFAFCENLYSVSIAATDPVRISLGDAVFHGIRQEVAVLKVPKGCLEAYKQAPQWKDFAYMAEYEAFREQRIIWNQEFIDCHVGDTLELNARATSGLEVQYAVEENQSSATVIGNKLVLKGKGEIKVTALQIGDAEYMAAKPVAKIVRCTVLGEEDELTDGQIDILGDQGYIQINGAQPDEEAMICDIYGTIVYQGVARRILLPAGIYVSKIGNTTAKVRVK